MTIKKGTILYHGSYSAIEKIDLNKCIEDKDFGKGFYLTSSLEQAISFIPSSVKKAYIFKRISEYCFTSNQAISFLQFKESKKYDF